MNRLFTLITKYTLENLGQQVDREEKLHGWTPSIVARQVILEDIKAKVTHPDISPVKAQIKALKKISNSLILQAFKSSDVSALANFLNEYSVKLEYNSNNLDIVSLEAQRNFMNNLSIQIWERIRTRTSKNPAHEEVVRNFTTSYVSFLEHRIANNLP